MGTFVPTRVTPDGRRMTIPEYNLYMQDVYNPQQNFLGSANVGIPGVNAPVGSGAGIPGLVGVAPPQSPLPQVPPQNTFQAAGPYGQQAMQMAGLLGQQPQSPPPTPAPGGLLAGTKLPFRPGGK